jgi:hypothetical protein
LNLRTKQGLYAGFHCLAAIQPRSDPGMLSLYVVTGINANLKSYFAHT